jgi:hypothetical protein
MGWVEQRGNKDRLSLIDREITGLSGGWAWAVRSNCAARGVDQWLFNAWVGHTTLEMQRRAHVIPKGGEDRARLVV